VKEFTIQGQHPCFKKKFSLHFIKLIFSIVTILFFSTAVLRAETNRSNIESEKEELLNEMEGGRFWDKVAGGNKSLQKNIITNLITKGIKDLDSWGVDNVELGIDDFLISKVIFSVHRSVIRNFHPKHKSEEYLVKDIFKIGLRLGAGYIVTGDVSLVRQYTLVYPVSNKQEGSFNNKFILNLFLPYHVHKKKLPARYVLMVEDFLEGRGKISLGGQITLPVGLNAGAGVVNLHRHFVDAKDDEGMLIFEDNSTAVKLFQDLFVGFSFLKLPLFGSSSQRGVLERKYIRVSRNDLDNHKEMGEAFTLGIWENNLATLGKFGTLKILDGTFLENSYKFSAFGLANLEGRKRYDHYREIDVTNENKETERYQLYQDRNIIWKFPTTGERKFKGITLMGEIGDHGQFNNSALLLNFRILDFKTKQKEIQKGYIPFIDTVTREKGFLKFLGHTGRTSWGTSTLKLDVFFSNKNLQQLEKFNESNYWASLAKVTGEKKVSSLTGRQSLASHFFKNRRINRLIHNSKQFLKHLKDYQNVNESPKERLIQLSRAIQELPYVQGPAFNGEGLGALIETLGLSDVHVSARLCVPVKLQKEIMEEAVLGRERGPAPANDAVLHPFVFTDPYQIWNLF